MSESVTLAALHAANKARQTEWCEGGAPEPDLAFRGNELAGETGEACNVIKKLERERHGWRGSRASPDQLAEELADVVICADLCAVTAGIDLGAAVVAKFNATSEKVGLTTRLEPHSLSLVSLAETINRARYTEGGLFYRTLSQSGPRDREYCERLAAAVLASLTPEA